MKVLALLVVLSLPSVATADTCLRMEGSTIVNECQTCMQVKASELRPRRERAARMFTGKTRSLRLDARTRSPLEGGQSWVITRLSVCH